nr:epidermal patterning factor-like protein 8 [Tanacetum cinerariifolium]
MPPIITCAAALNPCFNVHRVELLIESISLYNIYYVKYGNPTTESSSGTSSSRASGENQMSRLLNRLQEHTKKKARNDPSLSSEYERYVNSDFVTLLDNSAFEAFDLFGFWKAKESMFLVLSRMVMYIISVQATSVASESAFSTKRKQHKSGLANPIDFEEEILDAEVQQNEAIPLSEEEIAIDVASSEGTMSGSGSVGEEKHYNAYVSRSVIWMLITAIVLFFLTFSPSTAVNEGVSSIQIRKKILGSRPPGCIHKCMNCNPCRATLVIPPHHKRITYREQSSHGQDDCYYLLSWKCKCGDRLFQP